LKPAFVDKMTEQSSAFETEKDRVEFLRSRGVEVDLVLRKDAANDNTAIIDKTTPDNGFITEEQIEEWKRAQEKDEDLERMTLEEREQWLRDRGVIVETPEDRAAEKLQPDTSKSFAKIAYVAIPWDTSKPLHQCFANVPDEIDQDSKLNLLSQRDVLLSSLKPLFATAEEVDFNLLEQQSHVSQLLSSTSTTVSNTTMQKMAKEGHVETFTLVHPMPTNKHTQIQFYLDEVGMLKKLPLNPRAATLARLCGFDPPPKFYGNVFVGRISHVPRVQNVDFLLGPDLPPDFSSSSLPSWIQRATMDNLNHQMEINKLRGLDTEEEAERHLKANLVGEDGLAKEEENFKWTQTSDELELVVELPKNVTSKQISVNFRSHQIVVKIDKEVMLLLDLFGSIDTDGCTWTLDKGPNSTNLVLSCEKAQGGVSWPRISA